MSYSFILVVTHFYNLSCFFIALKIFLNRFLELFVKAFFVGFEKQI
ncbi:hypothetical protein HMPREF4655_21070 [Helicobacter pylori 35A]|nr:hypothetical protein HMPREF4655_21070 [Helicobacter pylori 35A]EJB15618.1 hypothetical protein HPCPY1124_0680 [Helicobacter pylori CPY1124]